MLTFCHIIFLSLNTHIIFNLITFYKLLKITELTVDIHDSLPLSNFNMYFIKTTLYYIATVQWRNSRNLTSIQYCTMDTQISPVVPFCHLQKNNDLFSTESNPGSAFNLCSLISCSLISFKFGTVLQSCMTWTNLKFRPIIAWPSIRVGLVLFYD